MKFAHPLLIGLGLLLVSTCTGRAQSLHSGSSLKLTGSLFTSKAHPSAVFFGPEGEVKLARRPLHSIQLKGNTELEDKLLTALVQLVESGSLRRARFEVEGRIVETELTYQIRVTSLTLKSANGVDLLGVQGAGQ